MRSGLEERVAKILGEDKYDYEPFDLAYSIPKRYTPDFVPKSKQRWLIEVKGRFRLGDQQKYKAIRDSLGLDYRLIFVFSNPNQPVRKGVKMTMGQWADKEKFFWVSVAELESGEIDIL